MKKDKAEGEKKLEVWLIQRLWGPGKLIYGTKAHGRLRSTEVVVSTDAV